MSQNKLPLNESQNVENLVFELPQPEPIKGYPELRWTGKRPFKQTHFYPARLKESYGDSVDGWHNKIYWGDNLQVMSHLLKDYRGKVDLIYIDPPFDSKAEYKKTISLKGKTGASDISNFEEKQYNDIWTNDEYLQFMYERLIIIRELLSDKGSIYLHCDWHKDQHLRSILDEIFGYKNLINEIVWCYQGTGNSLNQYKRKHDILFFYSKSNEWIFNAKDIGLPFTEKQKKKYSGKDENGYYKEYCHADGKVYRKYLKEDDFLPCNDWWSDIYVIQDHSERCGYPTQKPEALLERIILASTNPGSLVFDAFMGSGTTQAVAMKLGRRFLGADINLGAIQIATKRLENIISEKKKERQTLLPDGEPLYLNFQVYNVNDYDIFRNQDQARDLLIEALEIEKLPASDVFDGMKDGAYVKIMPVNRIATRADLNPILNGIDFSELEDNLDSGGEAMRILLVCMGHEPDLAANLKLDIGAKYKVDVKVVDILRDRRDLTFKYDSEAEIAIENDELVIRQFYPRNLLQKLSLEDEEVEDWRQLVETIAIDWNYNGEVLRPAVYDNPGKNSLVAGRYKLPPDYGNIRVKITDLIAESYEETLEA